MPENVVAKNIIIMGPQGSGKSTQGKLLAEKMNAYYFSTGERYRTIAKENSDLGQKVKAFLDAGELVDDPTTFELMDRELSYTQGGFVVDGFPRTLVQAEREMVPADNVIYLKVDKDQFIKRLEHRGREDDTPEQIATRLRLYEEKTVPILNYYREQGKLIEINGNGTVEEVHTLILAALGMTR